MFSIISCGDSDDPVTFDAKYRDDVIPLTVTEVESYSASNLQELQVDYQALLDIEERTFENSIECLDGLYNKGFEVYTTLMLLTNVAPEIEVRNKASEGLLQLTTWFYKISTDRSRGRS